MCKEYLRDFCKAKYDSVIFVIFPVMTKCLTIQGRRVLAQFEYIIHYGGKEQEVVGHFAPTVMKQNSVHFLLSIQYRTLIRGKAGFPT